MQKLAFTLLGLTAASPVFAASKNPFSAEFYKLSNTDLIVVIAFVLFIGVLVYLKVPGLVVGMLDKRADQIEAELEEARALREEAQTVLASYQRKQDEVKEQADKIVAQAKSEAAQAAEQAKADLAASIERRLKAAEDQIASAEASVLRDVKDRAAQIAVSAASDVIAKTLTAAKSRNLINDAIKTVDSKLH